MKKKILPTNTPVGNDPIKYAKINNDANFNANIFNNTPINLSLF